jgi:hypothetical protein
MAVSNDTSKNENQAAVFAQHGLRIPIRRRFEDLGLLWHWKQQIPANLEHPAGRKFAPSSGPTPFASGAPMDDLESAAERSASISGFFVTGSRCSLQREFLE